MAGNRNSDPNRVSPFDIEIGDIISFQKHIDQPEDAHPSEMHGMVLSMHTQMVPAERKADLDKGITEVPKILGYEVLPLKPYDKGIYKENDPKNFMLTYRGDIENMGLNTEKNYRISYSPVTVAYPEHMNKDGKGGVHRSGTLNATSLLDTILLHAERASQTLSAFFNDAKQRNNLQSVNSQQMTKIEEDRISEAGVNAHVKRILQDKEAADEKAREEQKPTDVVTRKLSAVSPPPKRPRKKSKNRKELKGAVIRDISLKDAGEIGLIHSDITNALTQHFRKTSDIPKTLQKLVEFADEKPQQLEKICEKAGLDAHNPKDGVITLINEARQNFFDTILKSKDDSEFTQQGIKTHYDMDGTAIDNCPENN